jgi:hypothetical protein
MLLEEDSALTEVEEAGLNELVLLFLNRFVVYLTFALKTKSEIESWMK